MPHVSFVAMAGFRVREREMLALGMSLPGLHDRARAVGALPSLGLLTLAGITPPGWSIGYHEAAAVTDELVARIVQEHPTLVAISALTASIEEAYRLSGVLRAQGIRVVLGGLHVTVLPDEAARQADAIVVGDGEPVWGEVLSDAERGRLRARYRAERPFDLAEARVPRFDLLGGKERPRYTVQTERGCPFACEFCGASRMLGPFREKPAARIAAELRAITAIRARATIELADDNTFAGKRDPAELFEVLAASGVRYFTEADWRIGERPEVLDGLAESGCVQVLVGLESMTPRHSGMGAKRASIERMVDAVSAIQASGVAVIGCFVVGGDGEDEESLAALGEFLLDAPFADVQLTVQTPFPGTALRARLEREGRLLAYRGWSSYTLFDVVHQPDRMTPEALQRAFYGLVKMVFSAGPTARRSEIRKRVWEWRQERAA